METICITGSNGFLGSVIYNTLSKSYLIRTIGRSGGNDIVCDLAQAVPKIDSRFSAVIHVAGKAHAVAKNDSEEREFFQVNLKGTQNLLKGIEQSQGFPESIIFISTVAVYGVNRGGFLTEATYRQAKDPYGLSKILAEDYLLEWGSKNNVRIGIIRPPLIVGANPPGNLGAMIKGIRTGLYFNIGGGRAKRSMVLAEDLADFIPSILHVGGIYNLTDGYNPSFSELSNVISDYYSKRRVLCIPIGIAKILAKAADVFQAISKVELPFNSRKLSKMTDSLTYCDQRARLLGWNPRDVLSNSALWLK